MFDTRLLTSFMAVAQHRHFGRAAEAIFATQPGVSQHIAKLEAQLGFQLLERTKRSVALTPAGAAFYKSAKYLVALAERMREEGQRIASGLLGEVMIGLASSAIYSDLPARMSAFKISNPGIQLRFTVQPGHFLKHQLDSGDVDIAISTLPMSSGEYHSKMVTHQEVGVAIHRSHPLSNRKRLTIDALRNENFIVVPREYDPEGHDKLVSRMHSIGATLKIVAYETPSLNVIARVSVNEGVALIPLGYRSESNDAIHVIPLRDPQLSTTPIYAAYRVDNTRPTVDHFMKSLAP